MASKPATSTKDRAALDALAKQVGGKAQYNKGRVEYKVSGKGYKSTRYIRPGDDINMGPPRHNPDDPRPYETVDRHTGNIVPAGISAATGANRSQLEAPESPTGNARATYEEAAKNLAAGGLSGNALTQAQMSLAGKYGQPAPAQAISTPAAATTPTQTRFQQGLAAANASGFAAPVDAGAARSGMSSYLPAQTPDTSVVDNIFSQDPVIGQLMGGIAELLSSKNQVPSIMEDYRHLRRSSGLDDINEEMIDAETILDGTEDDIRNEIQVAGGFGTESQVQAMTLARNKGLLKRYNQLVQMKTDATNQLNTMLQLTQQDRQMAQERINTQISTMFNMANFRQTALQNTRQQQQFMIQTMGADGYFATVSKDPRQLAMAEQIMGVAPGGLQAVAMQAAQEKARQIALQERQIRVSESGAAASWANVALARERLNFERDAAAGKGEARVQAQVAKADTVLGKVSEAKKFLGGGWSGTVTTGALGALAAKVPGSQAYNLRQAVTTIKANLGFDELQKMRDNSPTGGALGQVAVQELNMLQATVANLDTGQDAATLRSNLQKVEQHYTSWLNTNGYGVTTTGEIVPL